MIRAGIAVLFAALIACGEERPAGPPPDYAADVRAVAAIIDADTTGSAMDDADHAIDTHRPVMAANFLTEGALPATEHQIRLIELLTPATREGRSLQNRTVRSYRARLLGLTHYRDALARGVDEDEVLLDALHEASVAERELLALRLELVPHAPMPAVEEDLSGLPPLGEAHRDEADSTEEPRPDEHVEAPGELDDALPEM